jgi:acetyltransferase-like isoleucine patch superfamily enzyme
MENSEISESAIVLNSKIGDNCMILDGTRFCYSELGDYSYVSRNSNIFSTKIGKFSSISWNVSIGPANHDYHRITSHPILFASRFGMINKGDEYYNQFEGLITIGNDVWIGCNATIIRKPQGIAIGDGAVIAANAIVSENVPPYAIVVGVNRILKYRFKPEIIEALKDLEWWNMPRNTIKANLELISKNPTLKVIEKLKKLK